MQVRSEIYNTCNIKIREPTHEARAAALPSHSCFCTAMQKALEAKRMRVIRVIRQVRNQG